MALSLQGDPLGYNNVEWTFDIGQQIGQHVVKSRASEGRGSSLLEDSAECRRDYEKGHALSAIENAY